MTKSRPTLDAVLITKTRAELRAAIAGLRETITLPQAQRVISHAGSLGDDLQPLRLGIVHTYTSDLLQLWLDLEAALQGIDLRTYHAPYGQVVREAQAGSTLVTHEPDLTVLLLRREDLHPGLSKPITGVSGAQQQLMTDQIVEQLRATVETFRKHTRGQIVLTVLPSIVGPGLGIYDAHSEVSESVWWERTKAEIARWSKVITEAKVSVQG